MIVELEDETWLGNALSVLRMVEVSSELTFHSATRDYRRP
jgi:hypothetical protein